MRAFLNDLAPWIPVLVLWCVMGFVAVVGAAAAVEHIVVTVQQMIGWQVAQDTLYYVHTN